MNTTLGPLDIAIVVVYLAGVIGMSYAFARKQHTGEDYFLAGRRMRGLPLGASILANQASAVSLVGAPAFVPIMMRLMPWIWRKLKAVAHTLPYDAAVMTAFRVPRAQFASIDRPVLVLNGSKTDARLKAAARALAGSIPGAQHAELAGQTHNVNPAVLVAGVMDFLAKAAPAAPERESAKAGA